MWKSTAYTTENFVRNQIAVPIRYRNAISSAKPYPDHNLVLYKFEIWLKRIEKKTTKKRIDIKKLSNMNIEQQVQESVDNEIKRLKKNTIELTENWIEIEHDNVHSTETKSNEVNGTDD